MNDVLVPVQQLIDKEKEKIKSLSEILISIVELQDSGLIEQSRLTPQLNKARDILELW